MTLNWVLMALLVLGVPTLARQVRQKRGPHGLPPSLVSYKVETNITVRYARTTVRLVAHNPQGIPQQFPFKVGSQIDAKLLTKNSLKVLVDSQIQSTLIDEFPRAI